MGIPMMAPAMNSPVPDFPVHFGFVSGYWPHRKVSSLNHAKAEHIRNDIQGLASLMMR